MNGQIRYSSNGTRTYFIDGVEVTYSKYEMLCGFGDSRRLTEMFNEGRSPHGISDCTFMRDTANGRQFAEQEATGNHYRQVAESLGASVTGKKYVSGLAAFPGDPEAWVDSRGDVERLLTKRGWGSEGTINVRPRESENPPESGPAMAQELVDKYATEIAMRDPNPHLVDMVDLKEQVKERMAPKKKRQATKAD